jgi:hypothetical protein
MFVRYAQRLLLIPFVVACTEEDLATEHHIDSADAASGGSKHTADARTDEESNAGDGPASVGTPGAGGRPDSPHAGAGGTGGTVVDAGNADARVDASLDGAPTCQPCVSSEPCKTAGPCDPVTNACTFVPVADGSPCSNLGVCVVEGTCRAGACVATSPAATCAALDPCKLPPVCDPATGVSTTPLAPDQSPCEDGNPCTLNDTCVAGTCVGGSAVKCVAPDKCTGDGVCDPQMGACVFSPGPDQDACPGSISLRAIGTAIGVAPFEVTLKTYPTLKHAVDRIEWTFEGSGVQLRTGPDEFEAKHTYAVAGDHQALVTVTDVTGATWQATTVVSTLDRTQLVSQVETAWGQFVDSLSVANLECALSSVDSSRREIFRQTLAAGLARRAERAAKASHKLTLDRVVGAWAFFTSTDTQGSIANWPVVFRRDGDGIWRVNAL